MHMTETKICGKCKFEKPVLAFSKRTASRDGLQYKCQQCQAEYDAEYYAEHKEEKEKYHAKYREKHKGEKAEYNAEYYDAHKEEELKRQAKYAITHKEKIAEYMAEYYVEKKKDPAFKAQRNGIKHRRNARKLGAKTDNHTRQEVWDREKGICGICNKLADEDDWHKDHIIPLGPGNDVFENVRVTHSLMRRFANRLLN